jgi:hypothetical protein
MKTLTRSRTRRGIPFDMALLWERFQTYMASSPHSIAVCAWPFLQYRSAPGMQWHTKIGNRTADQI